MHRRDYSKGMSQWEVRRTSTGTTSLQQTGPQMLPLVENDLSYKHEYVFLDLMTHNIGIYNGKPLHLKLVEKLSVSVSSYLEIKDEINTHRRGNRCFFVLNVDSKLFLQVALDLSLSMCVCTQACVHTHSQ